MENTELYKKIETEVLIKIGLLPPTPEPVVKPAKAEK
jgi:hypothetical protein